MSEPMIRSKIVATVGPSCRERMEDLARAGVDVFRLNMAHGTLEEHAETVRRIRRVEEAIDRPLGVLVDLSGPKIRLGSLLEDPLPIHPGDRYRLLKTGSPQSPSDLTCSYEQLYDDLEVGNALLLADGTVRMRVISKSSENVELEAESSGELRSQQGINLPGVVLRMATVTPIDRDHARWAVDVGADFVSQSFVRAVGDLHDVRRVVRQRCEECGREPSTYPAVIAKIEKREALYELDQIVQAADAVMVARGDLGVEIDVAETPVVQKRILAVCRRYARPAIVATQMLDSMQKAPRPTRAEATDVANAILDGADACMLSGETAIGAYPIESVATMNRILHHTERLLASGIPRGDGVTEFGGVHRVTAAIVAGAGMVAERADASMIAVLTFSGATARALSQQRLPLPILGASHLRETARRMALYWGVDPLWIGPAPEERDAFEILRARALRLNWLDKGDRIVVVTGSGVAGRTHNEIVVYEEASDE